jgi:DNA polymerase-3 subunit delta
MEFLSAKRRGEPPATIVAFGDEAFLRREAVRAVREWVLGGVDDDGFQFASYSGDEASLAAVMDDLATPPFLGDVRLVLVEEADAFVSGHRKSLERFAAKPTDCGVLLLDVASWPATTNLYKLVEAGGLAIDCSAPKAWALPAWCTRWAEHRYGKRLDKPVAEWLVELVGANLGQLDQELSKLASYVGESPQIDIDSVNSLVVGTRTESVFKLLDMVIDGQVGKALDFLDRQLLAGETPIGVLGMLAGQLRRLARAARETQFGLSTHEALAAAGVPPFAVERSRAQLNHFGRERMNGMLRRLLRADLDLKGDSDLSARAVVSRLLIELSLPKRSDAGRAAPAR